VTPFRPRYWTRLQRAAQKRPRSIAASSISLSARKYCEVLARALDPIRGAGTDEQP
jgi:hypothetical protein